jgi:hypothetical protein
MITLTYSQGWNNALYQFVATSTPRLSTAASAALLSNSAHARLFPT